MNTSNFENLLKAEGYVETETKQLAAGTHNAAHEHPFDVRALVLGGEITLTVAGEARTYRDGEVFTMAAGCRHVEDIGPEGGALSGRPQAIAGLSAAGLAMPGMVETGRGTVEEWQRDHMGHINVRAYMEFFEQAVWPFYALLGMPASVLRAGEVHVAAVQQNISYKRELYPGDTVAVRCGVLELRDKVLRFRQEMFNTETGEVCALSEFTVVCLDPKARKSRSFPAAVSERAREYQLPEG